MASRPDAVVISATPMRLDELVAIARGARVSLADDARACIAASRAVVDAAMDGDELVYGLNTLVGHARDERVAADVIVALQPQLVAMHAGGMGPPLPREQVRAAMAARLNGIARGGSGASPAIADAIVTHLNAGIHAIVPSISSVGAGDLGQHALAGLVLLGEGDAEVDGRIVPARDALAAAGIAPLQLAPKDGLTLISANGFALGHAALVLERAASLLDAADTIAATTMDAVHANPSILDPAAMRAKGIRGQVASADRIREQLVGSERTAAPVSVQDALSIRVVPQVHGAAREVVAFAERAVSDELNAAADNPFASVETGRLTSNGNFHPMLVALAVDALRPALAHVGQLSERRSGRLWDTLIGGVDQETFTSLLTDAGAVAGLALRYPIAARATRLRQLAAPVTLDVSPLDLGQEDHATNAPEAVVRTAEALDVLADVLTVELLLARATILRTPAPEPAPATDRVLAAVGRVLESVGPDPAAIASALAGASLD
jgi:histidine ammonia-lyase